MGKRHAILDDGCNPELVCGSKFDGILEVPLIRKPDRIEIPTGITPFDKRDRCSHPEDEAIGFYVKDDIFGDVLHDPEAYIENFRRFKIMISPDCSLYRNAPLPAQVTNLYRNRAIGSYYQRKGLLVYPQVRWGNELTYTTKYFPEKIAFLGVEKGGVVAVGTYGCIKTAEAKYHFKAGLEAMLETLEPQVVLVYGAMPMKVFGDYLHLTQFIQFDNWTKRCRGGER